MKWFSFLLPLLLKQLSPALAAMNQSSLQLCEDFSLKSRKVALVVLAGMAAVLLFCGGLLITIWEAARQMDSAQVVKMNTLILAGISLVAVSLLTLSVAFRFWPGVRARKQRLKRERAQIKAQRESLGQAISLDQAVAMLILDFVKEREQKRQPSAPLASQDG